MKVKPMSRIIELDEDPVTGELILPLPDDLLAEVGWNTGDTINFADNKDGSWTMSKVEEATELVLVECIQSYRMRYVIEVPVGKKEWAEDTVTMQDYEVVKEFSQLSLGEQIISSRVVTEAEVLALCDTDNDYCSEWEEDKKLEVFVTKWKDINNA